MVESFLFGDGFEVCPGTEITICAGEDVHRNGIVRFARFKCGL